jgi:hypothetical protein
VGDDQRWMAQTSAGGQAPIPPARKDDSEDVAWALSTAEAMYARGDRGDALKWLRRAAESASEAQADDRALELFKAAADLATLVGPSPSAPPPPLVRPSAAPPPPVLTPPPVSIPTTPSQLPPTVVPSPSRPPPPVRAASAPLPSRAIPAAPLTPRPATRPSGAVTPSAPRTTEGRRAARRSRPDIDIARPPDEATQTQQDMALPLAGPKRRGRASRPAIEELTPMVPPAAPTPRGPLPILTGSRTDDIDAWPTQTHHPADDIDNEPPDEKTRIGVPAYEASAKMVTEVQSTPQLSSEPSLRPAQAIRVVVWRTADGVRVAPQGTHVAAITIEAVLVALDPAADLAAWLSGK